MVQIWDYRQTWYIHFYQIINNFQLFKNTVRNFINSESKIVYQVEAQTIERIQNIIRRYVISHFEGTAAEILTRMNESHRSCGASKVGFFVSIKLSKTQNSEICQNYRRKLNHAFDLLREILEFYAVSL